MVLCNSSSLSASQAGDFLFLILTNTIVTIHIVTDYRYHSNAVWTQIILVTCTWALAFLSLRFRTIVFKWVFFIFNSAQVSLPLLNLTVMPQ